ncbi:MAG: hypothetical protein WBG43_12415 [Marinifilaceae bacterium]
MINTFKESLVLKENTTIFEVMRIVAHILIILIITLNIIPCSETVCEQEKELSSLENLLSENSYDSQSNAHTDDHSKDKSDNHKDSCSPFCSCNCTHTAKSFPLEEIKEQIKETTSILFSEEYEFTEDSFNTELYRPPIV